MIVSMQISVEIISYKIMKPQQLLTQALCNYLFQPPYYYLAATDSIVKGYGYFQMLSSGTFYQ